MIYKGIETNIFRDVKKGNKSYKKITEKILSTFS